MTSQVYKADEAYLFHLQLRPRQVTQISRARCKTSRNLVTHGEMSCKPDINTTTALVQAFDVKLCH